MLHTFWSVSSKQKMGIAPASSRVVSYQRTIPRVLLNAIDPMVCTILPKLVSRSVSLCEELYRSIRNLQILRWSEPVLSSWPGSRNLLLDDILKGQGHPSLCMNMADLSRQESGVRSQEVKQQDIKVPIYNLTHFAFRRSLKSCLSSWWWLLLKWHSSPVFVDRKMPLK